jgi:hypothetical protein
MEKLALVRKSEPRKIGIVNAMLNIALFLSRLLLALLLAGTGIERANADSGSENAVKTAFLFNFFKFIEWPESAMQGGYSVCTTAYDDLGDSLMVLENKTIGSKLLILHRGINGKDLKSCHLIFISSSENAATIIRDLKGLPIITVSDKPGFVDQGGMIGLVQADNRLGFEINLDAANAGGAHISAQLLKLAKRVKTEKQ